MKAYLYLEGDRLHQPSSRIHGPWATVPGDMWQALQWQSQQNIIALIVMIFWILRNQSQELIHADAHGL